MVKIILKYFIVFLVLFSACIYAQPTTFVRTNASAKKVKVKQPFELRISVYTSTWFTSAPNLDHIVIPNALTIRKDRAQGIYETINNVRYTILYFDFFVFPLKQGELTIPQITLNYSTPEEGDYKGKEVTRKTKPFKIIVEKPDDGFVLSDWLVAKSFFVTESWNKKLSGLKVGDVIERTVTIKVAGTIGPLIPESDSIDVPNAKTYYKTPVIKSKIIDDAPVGERIEKMTYLLEKPGELIIPERKYSWWNPATKRIYVRRLAERKILVEDNPDLAILKSIQDSLDAINKAAQTEQVEEKPFTIFGLLVWQFIILIGVLLVVLNQFRKIILVIIKKVNERKAAYLQSEKFYFKEFGKACKQNNLFVVQNKLLEWYYKLNEENHLIPVKEFFARYGDDELLNVYNLFEEILFGKDKPGKEFPTAKLFNLIKVARKNYLNQKKLPASVNLLKINP